MQSATQSRNKGIPNTAQHANWKIMMLLDKHARAIKNKSLPNIITWHTLAMLYSLD